MHRIKYLSLAFLLILPAAVFSQDRFIVSDIRLEGLQRISPGGVFGLLNISVGDEVDQSDVANIIRDVFASDNFENVEVLQEETVLIIRVTERPTISAIELEGNKMIPTDALMENMENAGIAVGQTYKPSILAGMRLALEDQYIGQGRYSSGVEVDIQELDRNRVALNIEVDEGESSKILHLNIVGNSVFSDEELLDLFELRTSHLTSFFKKDDRYSREKINGDLERLTSYYMDRGYINFTITSTQVSVSPNLEEVYITVNVDEGEVYKVSSVQLAGDMADMEALFQLILQVREGETFSQQLVTTTTEFITQLLNSRGYFFAEAEGVPDLNEDDQTVDVTFYITPGSRTYVNRINFYGNTTTVDEVLRREMRQMEGAPASTVALEQSKIRMERLGYFSEVEYDTNQVPGTADQIDVDFNVEEQLNGSIGGSIGYAQVQKLVLSANLQQNNFLGTGTRVGVGVNTSRFSTSYNFNFYDPYYTIDGVSRGFSLSYVESDYAELGLASYSTNQIAGSLSYGYLIDETQSISFNFGANAIEISTGEFNDPVQEIKSNLLLDPDITNYIITPARALPFTNTDTGDVLPLSDAVIGPLSELPISAFSEESGFVDRFGSQYNNFTLGVTWSESTLNRGIFPTAGKAQNLSIEMSVPGSDLEYFKIRYFNEIYIPIYRDWIFHAKADLGYGDGYGENSELPFFLNFYAGGLGTIRGYEDNTLGPRSTFPSDYETRYTELLRDDAGEIILDSNGLPEFDTTSPQAYLLEQAVDAEGAAVVDANGDPVYQPRLSEVFSSRFFQSSRPSPFGGNIQTTGTIELLFPLPFLEDRSQVRSSFFIDGGNVFSSYCTGDQERLNNCSKFDVDEFRYSAGVSVTWLSGFGPMSFSLGKPFNASDIDETKVFQFTIGNNF